MVEALRFLAVSYAWSLQWPRKLHAIGITNQNRSHTSYPTVTKKLVVVEKGKQLRYSSVSSLLSVYH